MISYIGIARKISRFLNLRRRCTEKRLIGLIRAYREFPAFCHATLFKDICIAAPHSFTHLSILCVSAIVLASFVLAYLGY